MRANAAPAAMPTIPAVSAMKPTRLFFSPRGSTATDAEADGTTSFATMSELGSSVTFWFGTDGGNIAFVSARRDAALGPAATGALMSWGSSISLLRKSGVLSKPTPARTATFPKSTRLSRSKTIQGVDTGRMKARTSLSMRWRSG